MTARPKTKGLWVLVTLADGSEIRGMLPNKLLLLKPWAELALKRHGHPKLHLARAEVRECVVLGVIGAARLRRKHA